MPLLWKGQTMPTCMNCSRCGNRVAVADIIQSPDPNCPVCGGPLTIPEEKARAGIGELLADRLNELNRRQGTGRVWSAAVEGATEDGRKSKAKWRVVGACVLALVIAGLVLLGVWFACK